MRALENLNSYEDIFSERLTEAIKLHDEGVAGSASSAIEANRLFEKLRVDYPTSPLVDAYYGSSMILVARDKTKPFEQLKWSDNGLKYLDKAVAEAPQISIIRLLRGKSAYQLPEKYFRRTQTAIEDYTALIDQDILHQDLLNSDEYSQLINELGEAYYRIGRNQDAANLWRRLESETKDPDLKQLYTIKLQLLKGKPAVESITYENPASMLILATRAVGNALIEWSDQEKKKKNKKTKSKKRKKRKNRKKHKY